MKYFYLLLILCFISCVQNFDQQSSDQVLTNQKEGPTRTISGDSIPPPRRIDMKGMKGNQMSTPLVFEYDIPYKYLNEDKANKGNFIKQNKQGSKSNLKPLKLLTKTKALTPERREILKPATEFIPNKTVKQYSEKEGLKNNPLSGIALDSLGQLWLTNEKYGITQFDGTYAYYFSIEQGTPSDIFYDIQVDKEGILWMTSPAGLSTFDGEYFTTYAFEKGRKISVGNDHKFYLISENKLFKVDPLNTTFEEIKLNETGELSLVYQDPNNLWVATNKGICKLPKNLSNVFQFDFYEFSKHFQSAPILSMCTTKNNDIWMGSINGLMHWKNQGLEKESLYLYNREAACPTNLGGQSNTIFDIIEDDNGKLFLLVKHGGVVVLDIDKAPFSYTQNVWGAGITPYSNRLVKLKNQIWLASDLGIYSISENPFKFWNIDLKSKLPGLTCGAFDKWGRLWLGTYGSGIYRVEEKEKGGLKFYQHTKQTGLQDQYIDALLGDENGNLWIGSRVRGLSRIKMDSTADSDTIYHYKNAFGFPGEGVTRLIETKDGSIWGAIIRHSGEFHGGFGKFDEDGLLFYGKEQGLITDDIWALSIDSKNQIWPVNLRGYTYCFNLDEDYQINHVHLFEKDYTFIDKFPRTIAIDEQDNAWLGFQYGNNLTRIHPQQKDAYLLERFTEKEGVLDTKVFSIFKDSQEKLWIGTSTGLMIVLNDSINKDQIKFKFYDRFKGLPAASLSHLNAIFESKENEIWVTGYENVFWFDPDDIDLTIPSPNTLIKSIALFEEEVPWELGKKINLSNGVEVANFHYDSIQHWDPLPINLSLKHDNNFISFECVSLDIGHDEILEYSYKINDKIGWSKASPNSRIIIGKLNPDDYTFQVRSRLMNGDWGPIANYNFTIRPPWWKSWLAILGYLLFAILTVLAIIRIRVSIAVEKAKALEKVRSKISSDLHDDVGSLLTGISMQSEFLALESRPEMKNELDILGSNSREAMDKMRDIVWAMDATKDKYENLIDRMSHYLTKAFRNSKIDYDFEIKNIEGATFISPDKRQNIYLIFKEAITNILKHSGGDKVRISFTKHHDELILTIYDNGHNVTVNNAGQGIQNMKNRAKAIGGAVSIHQRNGFTIEVSVAAK